MTLEKIIVPPLNVIQILKKKKTPLSLNSQTMDITFNNYYN